MYFVPHDSHPEKLNLINEPSLFDEYKDSLKELAETIENHQDRDNALKELIIKQAQWNIEKALKEIDILKCKDTCQQALIFIAEQIVLKERNDLILPCLTLALSNEDAMGQVLGRFLKLYRGNKTLMKKIKEELNFIDGFYSGEWW